MQTKYFTLVARNSKTEKWSIEFGTYSIEEADAERDDMLDGDWKMVRIVESGDTQAEIGAAVAALNAK